MSFKKLLFTLVLSAHILAGCEENGDDFLDGGVNSGCNSGDYTPASQSAYVLPYSSGQSYFLTQGNCGGFSHKGAQRYAYDFGLPLGTTVVAARAGTVIDLTEIYPDGNGGTDGNFVAIQHSDGSVAIYGHLTQGGVVVNVNDVVAQGATIALSGNSGFSSGPHLHFVVNSSLYSNESIPVTFSNSSPAELLNLREGQMYTAL